MKPESETNAARSLPADLEGGKELPGWHAPLPETLPKPTPWPAVLAFGACVSVLGIVTLWLVSAAGFAFFVAGAAGWTADLIHEKRG
jgi:hypothetical protein